MPTTAPQTPSAAARSLPVAEGVADDRQRRREDQRGERAHREPRARSARSAERDQGADGAGGGEADAARGSAPGGGRSGRRGCRRPARARRRPGCSRRRSTAAARVPASSSSEMLGSATLTIVVSRLMASTAAQTVSRMPSLRLHGDSYAEMWTLTTSSSTRCCRCQHRARMASREHLPPRQPRDRPWSRPRPSWRGRAGPDGVVLREVARRTGVSHNAAYRHFADREELLAEVAVGGHGPARAGDASSGIATVTSRETRAAGARAAGRDRPGLRRVRAGRARPVRRRLRHAGAHPVRASGPETTGPYACSAACSTSSSTPVLSDCGAP